MVLVAQYGLLIILSLVVVFHVLVLLKIIPYTIVWGGRLNSDKEMIRFETISILINLIFVFALLIQSNFLVIALPKWLMTSFLWLMTALFLFNTFGNIISKNKLEQKVFTPITLLLSLFSLVLALAN